MLRHDLIVKPPISLVIRRRDPKPGSSSPSRNSLNRRVSFGTISSSMVLRDKYELGELITDGEVRTFSARELGLSRALLVHELVTSAAQIDLMPRVVKRLQQAPVGIRSDILDMFESEGRVYLVTSQLPGFTSLRDWLSSSLARAAPAIDAQAGSSAPLKPPSPPLPADRAPSGAPVAQPGEFTRVFQAPSPPSTTPTTAAPPGKPTGVSTGPASPSPSVGPQEGLTQIFQQSAAGSPAAVELSAPHFPLAARSSDSAQPGEFTKLFDPAWKGTPSPSLEFERPVISMERRVETLSMEGPLESHSDQAIRAGEQERDSSPEEGSFTQFFGSKAGGFPIVNEPEPKPPENAAVMSQPAVSSTPRNVIDDELPPAHPALQPLPAPPQKPSTPIASLPKPQVPAVSKPAIAKVVPPNPPKISGPPPPPPRIKPPQISPPQRPATVLPKPPGAIPQPRVGSELPVLPLVLIVGGALIVLVAVAIYVIK